MTKWSSSHCESLSRVGWDGRAREDIWKQKQKMTLVPGMVSLHISKHEKEKQVNRLIKSSVIKYNSYQIALSESTGAYVVNG